MSPSDIHSATSNISYFLGYIGSAGALNLGTIIGWEKWKARRRGREEGTMEQKMRDLEEKRSEDRKTIEGYGKSLEKIAEDVGALARQIAAFTGVANGIDYRKGGA